MQRLVVEWADAVAENFAPRAMKSFGLDYESLAAIKPDLVMMSACLNGQTGPHKDYPGFGGQGSALAGYNALTGWPDREPVGPYGTITDSLAPRYVAAALAAGLHYRRRTGHGVYLDLSQVESAIWTLAPWLLDYEIDGVIRLRDGNDHRDARLHGAFACADEDGIGDRWVTIACWTDDELGPAARRSRATTSRRGRARRRRLEVAEQLQAAGIEAVPVRTSATSTTIRNSRTAVTSNRSRTRSSGPACTSATAFVSLRVRAATTARARRSARTTTGRSREVLGLSDSEIEALRATGAVE